MYMKQVVIAGGGFAGIRLARALGKSKDFSVTLVNNTPNFRYTPALYRAATGFKLATARIPLDWALIDRGNVSLIVASVTGIDNQSKQIILDNDTKLDYDYVVFALGAVTSYFGISGLENHSFGIKSASEVLELKQHIHELSTGFNVNEHNYVIVGAGPTGVELAAAMGAYLKKVAKKHSVHNQHISIYLVEAGPRILPQMRDAASKKVSRRLKKLKVKVLCDTTVKAETAHSLKTSDGTIETHSVIWTAGTANNPFYKQYPDLFTFDQRGKVVVDEHLTAGSGVYVCGDSASTRYSGLAMTAVSHASFIAKDILARHKQGKRPKVYEHTPVSVVPVGGRWSVLQYKKLVLAGKFVGFIRQAADLIGYTDVLGPFKALTIWTNSERTEESCGRCKTRR